jgi:hypothetical protein
LLLLIEERFDPEDAPELLAVELLIVTPLLVIATEYEFVLDELDAVDVVELDVVDVPDEKLVSELELLDDSVEEVDVQLDVSDVQLELSHEDVELLIVDRPDSKESTRLLSIRCSLPNRTMIVIALSSKRIEREQPMYRSAALNQATANSAYYSRL